jgi:hypothetical protein
MTVECPLRVEPGPRAVQESRLVHVAIGDNRSVKSFANFLLVPAMHGDRGSIGEIVTHCARLQRAAPSDEN